MMTIFNTQIIPPPSIPSEYDSALSAFVNINLPHESESKPSPQNHHKKTVEPPFQILFSQNNTVYKNTVHKNSIKGF
jgi:hypothetical protein